MALFGIHQVPRPLHHMLRPNAFVPMCLPALRLVICVLAMDSVQTVRTAYV